METIEFKKIGLVELSLDEAKNIEGGFPLFIAFVAGLLVGGAIWLFTNND